MTTPPGVEDALDALRLYASLGFEVRREIDVARFTVPPGVGPGSTPRDQ